MSNTASQYLQVLHAYYDQGLFICSCACDTVHKLSGATIHVYNIRIHYVLHEHIGVHVYNCECSTCTVAKA